MRYFLALVLLDFVAVSASSQDTVVVRSDGPGVWRNPRLVEEVRIGVLDGDDRYIFGGVSHVEEMADGSVWIIDSQGPRVRIYDRTGQYVRDVSRAGNGPGELASVTGIDRTPDGRVAIWDLRNRRVSLFRPHGAYVTAFPASSLDAFGNDLQVDTAGRYWVFAIVWKAACTQQVAAPEGSRVEVMSEGAGCGRKAWLRFSAAGEPVDTVFVPIPDETEAVPTFFVALPEGTAQPFVPEWVHTPSPSGHFVIAHTMRYAIDIVPVDGRTDTRRVTRIERAHEPVPLTRGERSEWQARADFHARRLRNGASSGVQLPEVKPPLRSISADDDGRIWVDRYVAAVKHTDVDPRPAGPDRPPPLTWREPRTFDVFETSGRFLGTVVAPPRARFVSQRGSTLWAVVRGEMDEHYVVRYRLVTN